MLQHDSNSLQLQNEDILINLMFHLLEGPCMVVSTMSFLKQIPLDHYEHTNQI